MKSCKYCGQTHAVGFVCEKKPKRIKPRTDEAGFRSRWAWTKKAKAIKERDHFLCLACLVSGKVNHGYLEVHHIVPLREDVDLGLDDDNLITLCVDCHEMAENGEISRDYLRGLIGHTPRGGGLANLRGAKTTQPWTRAKNQYYGKGGAPDGTPMQEREPADGLLAAERRDRSPR